ncbi:hybrid sensor histidine kinase/response regulator [Pseudanabaena yagii]|uniref:histidine kinase n=1 Tax=Pseudanabaena yagii GIHE-NHR1 TaxID=2722753 RepID=A0ABX1LRR4_9CYAN|nr:hybrid sensor histidine kinase/response regulator [Pseudanabaena yagii]NMF57765.1 response regulator [Pseudanabaena yagii GIHE-NHR1]
MSSILVIDDETYNFDVIQTLLSNQTYKLDYATSGQDALDNLEYYQPDVILLDVMMPKMDGMEVCRRLKSMDAWKHVPIIMVTSLTAKKDIALCLESGADDFISKPVDRIELGARVKSMLRIKQQYDQIKALSKLQENTIHVLQNNMDELCGNLSSSLPHELNTPLNGVFGAIEMVINDHQNMESEEIHEWLSLAKHSIQRLEKLTKKFMEYTKLEIFAINPKIDESRNTYYLDLPTMILIENACAIKANNRLNDLVLDLEDINISMNEKDFVSMINELIENACKFSKSGTPIKVASWAKDDVLHLSISDQGRGMTEDQINRIGAFIQFERRYYEQQGIGLGLKIAKKIVEIYQGKFSISSSYGQGTTINIELPLTTSIL